jgi:multidrug efflux pump subunit AcrA (membrane-fusion protein)
VSANFYRKIELLEPQVREAFLALAEHLESLQRTEKHMEAISAGMERLTQAQAGTDARVGRLEAAMVELAQAEARTEKRLEELAQAQARTEKRLEELAQAQARTEERVGRLEVALEELAQAQARTEKRLEELAQAQAGTDARVGRLEAAMAELAQAQARTERRLERLIGEHAETRRQLGGLSAAVGYGLEDRAFKALPELLRRDYGLELLERLRRGYLRDNEGQMLETNILGRAKKDGREILIVGEAKSQLSKGEVDRFLRRKLARLKGIGPELFPVIVTYMTTAADVEDYARGKGLALYFSFDF